MFSTVSYPSDVQKSPANSLLAANFKASGEIGGLRQMAGKMAKVVSRSEQMESALLGIWRAPQWCERWFINHEITTIDRWIFPYNVGPPSYKLVYKPP